MIKYKKRTWNYKAEDSLNRRAFGAGQLKLLSLYYRRRPQSGANKQFCL